MGLFSREKPCGGMIGYFGLGEWWIGTFSEADRRLMAQLYRDAPVLGGMGPCSLDAGDIRSFRTTEPPSQFLAELAVLADKSAPHLVPAFLARAEEEAIACSDPLDIHFAESQAIKLWYKRRDSTPGAFDAAVAACEKQIALAPRAAPALKREGIWPVSHRGFQQLAVIREKDGDYAEALRLCREAQGGGWLDSHDDWSKRIARLERRASKA